MLGKVNSPRSQWHCSNWDICSVWQRGGQIVESCRQKMSSPFLTDINSTISFMFNFISFQVAYPKQLLLKPQIESFTFHTHLGGTGSHGIFSAPRLLEFPQAFLDWRRSDGLIPGLRVNGDVEPL